MPSRPPWPTSAGPPAERARSREIIPVKGVTLVGPLPAELQKFTVYSAGLAARGTAPEVARAFIAFLTRADFKPKFAAAGLGY